MNNEGNIYILEEVTSDDQAMGPGKHETKYVQSRVNERELTQKLHDFSNTLGKLFSHISSNYGDFHLDTIEVKADITTKAELAIRLVSSASIETSGGLTLVFKRKQ